MEVELGALLEPNEPPWHYAAWLRTQAALHITTSGRRILMTTDALLRAWRAGHA